MSSSSIPNHPIPACTGRHVFSSEELRCKCPHLNSPTLDFQHGSSLHPRHDEEPQLQLRAVPLSHNLWFGSSLHYSCAEEPQLQECAEPPNPCRFGWALLWPSLSWWSQSILHDLGVKFGALHEEVRCPLSSLCSLL